MSYLNLHTHLFTDKHDILEIVNQYPREFDAAIPHYSIGIHPWYLDVNHVDEELAIIESKLQFENCLAVGECGLDKRIAIPLSLQSEVFEKQLHLAQKYAKPVILHCVAAFQELIAIKNQLKITVPMIVHGFSKNEIIAKQLVDAGFYLSFGKYLLRNPELETVFKTIPNDRFFLETDTMEEGIREVYAVAAKLKNLEKEVMQKQIQENYVKVFSH